MTIQKYFTQFSMLVLRAETTKITFHSPQQLLWLFQSLVWNLPEFMKNTDIQMAKYFYWCQTKTMSSVSSCNFTWDICICSLLSNI